MTAGLFNQCIAKWLHTILSWLTTETKLEPFYILFKCRCHPKKLRGEGKEEVVNKLTLHLQRSLDY